MPARKPRPEKQRKVIKSTIARKKKRAAIFEEVEDFEELGQRMQELLLTEPQGTRIYLRVRDRRMLN